MEIRRSYLHNGISYTGKTPSLYWIRALVHINTRNAMACRATFMCSYFFIRQAFSGMADGFPSSVSVLWFILAHAHWAQPHSHMKWADFIQSNHRSLSGLVVYMYDLFSILRAGSATCMLSLLHFGFNMTTTRTGLTNKNMRQTRTQKRMWKTALWNT